MLSIAYCVVSGYSELSEMSPKGPLRQCPEGAEPGTCYMKVYTVCAPTPNQNHRGLLFCVGFAWLVWWEGKKPAMEVFFLWQAARSFLHAWQNQLRADSDNRHAPKPIREVSNASVRTY